MGRFRYAQNKYQGFTQVHADENELSFRIMGINGTTNDLLELYKVQIYNHDSATNVEK